MHQETSSKNRMYSIKVIVKQSITTRNIEFQFILILMESIIQIYNYETQGQLIIRLIENSVQ